MREVWAATAKEVDGGWMGPGLTLEQLLEKYGNVDGSRPQNGPVGTLNARVMMRHGVYQGYKQQKDKKGRPATDEQGAPVWVRKLRCIDDAKASGSNSCQYTYETIAACGFDFIYHAADEVTRACKSAGKQVPLMVFSTDDMRAAYRQVPCSQPGHTVVCIYKFGKEAGPRFFSVHGFNFGHVSSVVTYNRCPELMVHAARKIFLCVCEHYVDDFAVYDVLPRSGHGSHTLGHSRAQQSLAALHKAVGLVLEPDKSVPPKQTNIFLGVQTHLQWADETGYPRVVFTPSEYRVRGILDKLAECRAKNHLDAREASVLQGKLQFIRGHSFRGVGRAATQPLLTRSGRQTFALPGGAAAPSHGSTTEFDEPMQVMYDFLKVLLTHLPPLVRSLGGQIVRKPVLVYSDAQYNAGTGSAGLGVVVVDLENPDEGRFVAGSQTSPELLLWLEARKQQVNALELLAVLCACMTFKDILAGREVAFYIDNTTALSACVHGSGNAPDVGKMANAVTLLLARLECVALFKHVPGKANPADIPSRAPWIPGPDEHPILDISFVVDKEAGQQARDRACARSLNRSHHHRPLVLPQPRELEDLAYFLTGAHSAPLQSA